MEDDKRSLFQPLIPLFNPSSSSSSSSTTTFSTAATSSSYSLDDYNNINEPSEFNSKTFISNNNIILRILLVLIVAAISIWANYVASRTLDVIIVNDARDSVGGKRFDLNYVSNDKAIRIVLNTSSFVEHYLYPDDGIKPCPKKKRIESVTLRLSNATASVSTAGERHEGGENFKGNYVIDISPMLLEGENYYCNNMWPVVGAIQRATARIWLWDSGSRAPSGLVDGMAEFVAELAGFPREGGSRGLPECEGRRGRWWEDKDPVQVARYLRYYESYREGFIRRLNQAMRDTWHDRMVDDVLGMSSMKLCGLYNASIGSISSETRFV